MTVKSLNSGLGVVVGAGELRDGESKGDVMKLSKEGGHTYHLGQLPER